MKKTKNKKIPPNPETKNVLYNPGEARDNGVCLFTCLWRIGGLLRWHPRSIYFSSGTRLALVPAAERVLYSEHLQMHILAWLLGFHSYLSPEVRAPVAYFPQKPHLEPSFLLLEYILRSSHNLSVWRIKELWAYFRFLKTYVHFLRKQE